MANWLDTLSAAATPGAARKQSEAQMWAQYARATAAALQARTALPEVNVAGMGPVLYPGERALFHGGVDYARLYGGDGSYSTTGLLALGSPAFMIGAFAAAGVINHRRKSRARREAAVVWRDQQRGIVIATNQRVLVHHDGGWSTYAYGAITEYYPDPPNATLTLGFGPNAAPMSLSGPPTLTLSVLVAAATQGERWTQDPRLHTLLHNNPHRAVAGEP